MLRKDREVKDINEIIDILRRCDTVRIGVSDNEFPYVVPVSFGTEIINGSVVIYFHCAKRGMKVDLLCKNPNVCIESDIFDKIEQTEQGITARYESVIGFGSCMLSEDPDEVRKGLEAIVAHYGYRDYPIDRCAAANRVFIGKITLKAITAKRSLSAVPQAKDTVT